jgi:hypothetical protein
MERGLVYVEAAVAGLVCLYGWGADGVWLGHRGAAVVTGLYQYVCQLS